MAIAFFDSGIGGLSVLQEALHLMPNEKYIYYADSENAPYGTKSSEEIEQLVFKAVDFLATYPLKALVLACNTATMVVVKKLRAKYDFPIIGMEPAVKPAIENSPDKMSLVCATELTLKAAKLNELIHTLDAEDRIQKLSLQKLVTFAEKYDFDSPKVKAYLKKQFKNIAWDDFDSIVLGCTHFLFFIPIIQKMIPDHIHLLDGNLGTVRHLSNNISKTRSNKKKSIQYFISGKTTASDYFESYLNILKKQTMRPLNLQPFPKLETPRLLLRKMKLKDSKALLPILQDTQNRKYLDVSPVQNVKEVRAYIQLRNGGVNRNEWIFWIISLRKTEEVIGSICLWNFSKKENKADVGYELSSKFQGKGFMNEALQEVIQYGFNTLNLHHIVGETHIDNWASVKLLERNHFVKKTTIQVDHSSGEYAYQLGIYSLSNKNIHS